MTQLLPWLHEYLSKKHRRMLQKYVQAQSRKNPQFSNMFANLQVSNMNIKVSAMFKLLIHWADPHTAGSAHYIHTCCLSVCPSVHPHFSNSRETKQVFPADRMWGWPRESLTTPSLVFLVTGTQLLLLRCSLIFDD